MTEPAEEDVAIAGAACRLYRQAPSWEGRRTAAVGKFRCESADAGAALLEACAGRLAREGFQAIIGPMDGDTWHSYRVVTESDGSPPFLMEPVSGPQDRSAFAASGFAVLSDYVSTRTSLDAAIGPSPAAMDGVEVTPWDGGDAARLIGQLFALSAGAFARNAFFKPLDQAGFLKLYEPVMPLIDRRFVLFARDRDGELAGFLFGLPNRLEGASPRTAILKTYASLKRGVGHLLADQFHRRAREAGFTHAIHALMHVDNISLERSKRYQGTVFRRYALTGRQL